MSQPNSQDLKTLCEEKIASASLDDAQLAALKAKTQPAFTPPAFAVFRAGLSNWQKVAGLLLLLGVGLMAHTQWQAHQRAALIEAITQEVVDNHLKQRPLEFQQQSLAELDKTFTELEFTLVETIQLPELNNRLLGGRYCSIQGRTAAQLRLGGAGRAGSLYQVPFDASFERLGPINVDEQPLLRYARGLQVTLWEEKGVLLALVQAADALEPQAYQDAPQPGLHQPKLPPLLPPAPRD